MFIFLFLWLEMFAENDGPIFWKKGLNKFQANFSDWWLGHLLWNGPQTNFAGPTSPLALMYDVSYPTHWCANWSSWEISLAWFVKKKVNGSVVMNLAVNSMPMLFFGKCSGRHRLKTFEPSSAAGSHFHYSDGIMSAMVSNHWRLKCLPNRLFRHRSKKTSKLSITGVCEGNSPMTGKFPAQRASKAENVSIWWCCMFFVQCISLKECL